MTHEVETLLLAPAGAMPNNPDLPLLLYRGVLPLEADVAARCEAMFEANGWPVDWRAHGIHPFHHYHSTRHEAIGVARGTARVRFGGEEGPVVEVAAGDVVVIPAGVAHKGESASADFLIVGAYPKRPDGPDQGTGRPELRARELRSIAHTKTPSADPVFGAGGPLTKAWEMVGATGIEPVTPTMSTQRA